MDKVQKPMGLQRWQVHQVHNKLKAKKLTVLIDEAIIIWTRFKNQQAYIGEVHQAHNKLKTEKTDGLTKRIGPLSP